MKGQGGASRPRRCTAPARPDCRARGGLFVRALRPENRSARGNPLRRESPAKGIDCKGNRLQRGSGVRMPPGVEQQCLWSHRPLRPPKLSLEKAMRKSRAGCASSAQAIASLAGKIRRDEVARQRKEHIKRFLRFVSCIGVLEGHQPFLALLSFHLFDTVLLDRLPG